MVVGERPSKMSLPQVHLSWARSHKWSQQRLLRTTDATHWCVSSKEHYSRERWNEFVTESYSEDIENERPSDVYTQVMRNNDMKEAETRIKQLQEDKEHLIVVQPNQMIVKCETRISDWYNNMDSNSDDDMDDDMDDGDRNMDKIVGKIMCRLSLHSLNEATLRKIFANKNASRDGRPTGVKAIKMHHPES
jgi:hypothetical protein